MCDRQTEQIPAQEVTWVAGGAVGVGGDWAAAGWEGVEEGSAEGGSVGVGVGLAAAGLAAGLEGAREAAAAGRLTAYCWAQPLLEYHCTLDTPS